MFTVLRKPFGSCHHTDFTVWRVSLTSSFGILWEFFLKPVFGWKPVLWLLQRHCDKPAHIDSRFHLDSCEQILQWISSSSFFSSIFPFPLICCSSASISPSISPHLCLPLLCWSAYHLVWDGDLIGHLQPISLIANNWESRGISQKLSVTTFVSLPRSWRVAWSKREDSSSSVDIIVLMRWDTNSWCWNVLPTRLWQWPQCYCCGVRASHIYWQQQGLEQFFIHLVAGVRHEETESY